MRAKFALSTAAATLFASTAMAMPAVVTADLALRAGPGPAHPIVASLERQSIVELDGCIDGGAWCRVTANGVTGWTYATYLGRESQGKIVAFKETTTTTQVPTVTYEQRASTVADKAPVIVEEAIVPADQTLGTLKVGSITVDPPPEVKTYVTTHKIEPILLEGEVVVGATLPRSVVVHEVPKYEYRYTTVNGRTVLVEPATNRIVYVYR